MAKAYLMVRAAVVDAADRPNFDRWYEAEHLPDAVARFGAERGWRCWSRTDPAVLYAFYEFSDVDRARSVPNSPEFRALVAEFDRAWGARVARTRDVLERRAWRTSTPPDGATRRTRRGLIQAAVA